MIATDAMQLGISPISTAISGCQIEPSRKNRAHTRGPT